MRDTTVQEETHQEGTFYAELATACASGATDREVAGLRCLAAAVPVSDVDETPGDVIIGGKRWSRLVPGSDSEERELLDMIVEFLRTEVLPPPVRVEFSRRLADGLWEFDATRDDQARTVVVWVVEHLEAKQLVFGVTCPA